MARAIRTDTDNSTARASACDAWARSTRDFFVKGCSEWRTHPEHAMTRIRPIVEGFAHLVCLAFDPTFETHERGRPRRVPMEKALLAAKRHLPTSLSALADHLKNLGNTFHHNQGTVLRSSPNAARGALLQCAELLTWLDSEVLRDAPPPEYIAALRQLEGAAPVVTPLPSSAATPVGPQPRRRSRFTARLAAGVSLAGVSALAAVGLAFYPGRSEVEGTRSVPPVSPEVEWVESYNRALASRDVDQILALHVLPTANYFGRKNQDGAALRTTYSKWFAMNPDVRTGLRDCVLATMGADGARALRCEAFQDSPRGSRPLSATCLVFRSDGLLLSRTEAGAPLPCPPP